MQKVLRWCPWFLIMAYTIWATSPFWLAKTVVFAGKFSSDNAVSAWYYGWVARSLENGAPLQTLSDFNYPRPWPRSTEFPNVLDATLTAPFWWLWGWPRGWSASQAVTIFVSAAGCAGLARALGCKGLGLVTAGLLGVLCRPHWKDLAMARMNAVWPGLALLALAALILAVRKPNGPQVSKRPIQRSLWALCAAALGALAVGVYPPYLLLLLPVGILLLIGPLWNADRLGWILLGSGLMLGILLGWDSITEILDSRDPSGGQSGGCPNRYGAVKWTDLFRSGPDVREGLSIPGVATGSWMLMGFGLLHEKRLAVAGILVFIGLLVVLSLGPCPQSVDGVDMAWQSWPIAGMLPSLWDFLSPINDWGRMATIAVLLAAVCSGLGIEKISSWGWPGRGVALLLIVLAVGQAHRVVMTERLDPMKWHPVPAPASAQFLQTAEIGPVADLPFDRKYQFLSVLWAPDHPRINPLRPADHPPEDPVVQWLYSLGRSNGEFVMELGDPRGVTGLRVSCSENGQVQWENEVPIDRSTIRIGNLPERAECTGTLQGVDVRVPLGIRPGIELSCTLRADQLSCEDRRPGIRQFAESGLRWIIVDQPRCATDWLDAPVCTIEGKQALRELLGSPIEFDGIQIWDLQAL